MRLHRRLARGPRNRAPHTRKNVVMPCAVYSLPERNLEISLYDDHSPILDSSVVWPSRGGRRLCWRAGGWSAAVVTFAVAPTAPVAAGNPDVVQAHKFVIVDRDGRTRAIFSADATTPRTGCAGLL